MKVVCTMTRDNKRKITFPRYQQIAVALAERIVSGKYPVGSKLHARSTLASNFKVSPETARKAINMLADLDIMEVKHGSGAYIASKEKAQEFLANYQETTSLAKLETTINQALVKQKDSLDELSQMVSNLVERTQLVHKKFPFSPFELVLPANATNLDRSINELNLWHSTGATLIAIRHAEQLLVSPGPYAKLAANDTIYFVGSELSYERVCNLFNISLPKH